MRYREDLVFPIEEYTRRLDAVRNDLRAAGLDALLVTTPENITYLTGFHTPGHYWFQGMLVPLEGEPFTYSRRLETHGVDVLTWVERNYPYEDSDDCMAGLAARIRDAGVTNVGYEKDCWFFTSLQQEQLRGHLPKVCWTDASGVVPSHRLVKSDLEIEQIRRAASCAAAAMEAGIAAVSEGRSENDVAAEIMATLIRSGSHWPSIVPFIASGERGAIGHATWNERVMKRGDGVFLELAGCRNRYHAAMMRTVVIGGASPRIRQAFEAVDAAFEEAMATIRPGVTAGDIDALCRRVIAERGFGDNQTSRTAYSIGLAVPPDWGEGQILSMKPGEQTPLQANMTFHLIPWVQLGDDGGVGCTETVRVTHDGCERLTTFPRQLFEA